MLLSNLVFAQSGEIKEFSEPKSDKGWIVVSEGQNTQGGTVQFVKRDESKTTLERNEEKARKEEIEVMEVMESEVEPKNI